jgi:hypothetical protein
MMAAFPAAIMLLAPTASAERSSPVPDWATKAAAMPTPDYAKNAPAVVLYDEYVESVDAQGRAVEQEHVAVRILQPQGRRDAVCRVFYDVDEKVNVFRSWTIAANGKIFTAKNTDFVDQGLYEANILQFTERARTVNPPAADPGATVACETEELLPPYQHEVVWGIQHSIPAVDQILEVDLPVGVSHAVSWHRHDPVTPVATSSSHWRWEIKDERGLNLSEVKASLEWEALAARMTVLWGDAAVDGRDNQWRALGQWFTGLEEHRPDPTPEISAQAQALTAGAPDFYTKLKNITEYIQNNIRYFVVIRGIGGFQAHYAGDIFHNRYGDCKDKTTLLISMLQAVGIEAHYVAVDDRRGVVDPASPSTYGDHMITSISVPPDVNDPRLMALVKGVNGKRYLIFDPTNERVPVGNLPDYEQGGFGLMAAAADSQILAFPVLPPEANTSDSKGSFTLSADGTLTGTVDTSSLGPGGADLRYFLKNTDDRERREYWEKQTGRDLPGFSLDSFAFVQPADLNKPIEFHYKVTEPEYAHVAGPLLLVRPRVVGEFAVPFDEKPRTLPIDLGASRRWRESYNITLPPGYVVDETPDPVSVDLDFASYHSSCSIKGNVLHYEREYIIRQVELPASRAADFRHLQSQIVADERGDAVLKKQ